MSAVSRPRAEFLPAAGERAVTRAAQLRLVQAHLAPYEAEQIERAANTNQRSAREWQDGRALPSAVSMSALRAWLPGLDADLRVLEAADRALIADLRLQYGPQARLAEGD